MSLRVIFLGTGGSVPTTARGLPAILVQREGEQIMFDCGEGVQRQMTLAHYGFHKITKIFITHMHGDHVLGLPGLLQTMALLDRERKLDVYGPTGLAAFVRCVKQTLQFSLTFSIEIHEIERAGMICEEEDYMIEAAWSNHVIPSLAYALVEKPRSGKFDPQRARLLGIPEGPMWSKLQRGHKIQLSNRKFVKPTQVLGRQRAGRKIVYTGDTRPFQGLSKFAAKADLLIHDATLDDEMIERANQDGHSTPRQAALTAKSAKVKALVLTHISARYGDTTSLLKQAQEIFSYTEIAEDFMEIELELPDD